MRSGNLNLMKYLPDAPGSPRRFFHIPILPADELYTLRQKIQMAINRLAFEIQSMEYRGSLSPKLEKAVLTSKTLRAGRCPAMAGGEIAAMVQ